MRIVLNPRETMRRRRAKDRLAIDADAVHGVIRTNPGIVSKAAIAAKTGLSKQRVHEVLQRINSGETGHVRVEYGKVRPPGGPHAGQVVQGWYAMNLKRHHAVMDQADEHSALTEVGVRRSRLVRFAQAQGIRHAEAWVERIEQRLGLSIEVMSEADLAAFEELLLAEAAA